MSLHNIQCTEGLCTKSLPRVALLTMGRKRPGFDMPWSAEMEAATWSMLDRLPLSTPPFKPQNRVIDDPSLRQAISEIRQAGCSVLVVMQPSIGDGRLLPILAQLWDAPLVLLATPERPAGPKVSSCSLVGTHVFASLLRQLNKPFEIVYGHPDQQGTLGQLLSAVRICAAGGALKRTKVGLVGMHAPGFINLHADPLLLSSALGVQMQHFGMQEFFDLVEQQDAAAVEADVACVRALNLPQRDDITAADLALSSRYYLALRSMLSDENLDALAVRCWPEMPARMGHWPYLAMVRLADEGQIVALEGDVDGALSCLVAKLAGIAPGYLSDWIEHDEHTITLWHPGQAPLSICDRSTARLGRHFNNNLPMVVDAALPADQALTLFRLWRCDGAMHAAACDVRTVASPRQLEGVSTIVQVDDRNVYQWFDDLCHAGMPHHVAVLPGNQAALLTKVLRQLNVGINA
jgi:L-fucose isomerase-like protein